MAYITLPAADERIHGETTAGGEFIQRLQIVRSGNSGTPVTADASGLQVQLGAPIPAGDNNMGNVDVVTMPADPFGANDDAAAAGAGSINAHLRQLTSVGLPVTALPALAAGTAFIGKAQPSDGTTDADVVDTGGTYNGLATALVNAEGDQVSLSQPIVTSASPTLDTSAYAAGDSMDSTIISFTNAVAFPAGSGHILRMTVIDDDDLGADFTVHFFEASVSPATENSPHSLSDGDADEYIGSISTSDGVWQDHANNQTCTVVPAPPLPFKLDAGTTLYAIAVAEESATRTASGLEIKLHILPD